MWRRCGGWGEAAALGSAPLRVLRWRSAVLAFHTKGPGKHLNTTEYRFWFLMTTACDTRQNLFSVSCVFVWRRQEAASPSLFFFFFCFLHTTASVYTPHQSCASWTCAHATAHARYTRTRKMNGVAWSSVEITLFRRCTLVSLVTRLFYAHFCTLHAAARGSLLSSAAAGSSCGLDPFPSRFFRV